MKTTIFASAAVLLVKDVEASAEYYHKHLGFEYERLVGDPPKLCVVNRGGASIMLVKAAEASHIAPHSKIVQGTRDVYIWVDNADALYQEMRAAGVKIDHELSDSPNGFREFGVQDVDGYDIAFGHMIVPEE
jgi:predicted lactoylglutathione lyase